MSENLPSRKSPQDDNNSYIARSFKTLTILLKEHGLHGFLLVIVTFIFLVWGTKEQKQEFIDIYILFKEVNSNPAPYFMIGAAIIFLVINYIYSKKINVLRKEENKRIGTEKNKYQEKVLNSKNKTHSKGKKK